jgi:hypothetical protein
LVLKVLKEPWEPKVYQPVTSEHKELKEEQEIQELRLRK